MRLVSFATDKQVPTSGTRNPEAPGVEALDLSAELFEMIARSDWLSSPKRVSPYSVPFVCYAAGETKISVATAVVGILLTEILCGEPFDWVFSHWQGPVSTL